MNKKIVGIFVCILLLLPMLSSAKVSTINDDLEIKISAGIYGRDIGLGLKIDIMNNKNENITIYMNLFIDYLIRNYMDINLTNTKIVLANDTYDMIWVLSGICYISITVEGGNTEVKREGICILGLVILFK